MPGLVLCHGFPVGPLDARQSAGTFPELIDRIASEMGFAAMTFTFRGCGQSEGDFSLLGWLDDLRAAVDHLWTRPAPRTSGSPARAPADRSWCARARSTIECAASPRSPPARTSTTGPGSLGASSTHARDIGAVRNPNFPPSFEAWARELRALRPLDAARRLAPKPLLIVHGDDDEYVPTLDPRLLAEAHGSAELRIVTGAGHRLRHDPRAVAVLLGWLDRERNRVATSPA